jgi:hypothetical protein
VADDTDRIRRAAAATLVRNWRGSWTVPSARLYPHQWSWDSGFIAVGWARLSTRRAFAELATLHGAQWSDGRVPHIVFSRSVGEEAYFPGPAFWRPLPVDGPPRGVSTTGLVQPPVHAVAALAVARLAAEAEIARHLPRLYRRLDAHHDYLFRRRRVASGLVAIVHPWESGLDNSPLWDEPLLAVPAVTSGIAGRRRDLASASGRHRPTDEDYARYLHIAGAYRDRGCADDAPDALPFHVVDPLFNTVLAWSERSMAELAAMLGRPGGHHLERADALERAVHDRLYDASLGCYTALDVRTGRPLRKRTIAGLVPLVLPGIPAAHRRAVLDTLVGPAFRAGDPGVCGVPTYDLTAPDLELQRYWRGPTWINTNWLLLKGLEAVGEHALAGWLRASMAGLVAGGGFREYFDPTNGAGLGADDFSWSAALVLDVLASDGSGTP